MAGLNYETEKSQETIRRILAFLLGRPREGATLKQIQSMLDVSHGTAHRFVNYLLDRNKIHVSVEAKATQQGHTPAYFRLGRRITTPMIPGMAYRDIPLNFFGNKPMTIEAQGSPPAMTDYMNASDFHPAYVGPYRCKMIGAFDDGTGVTHMRWWDGEDWSYPLQPDHEDLDGNYIKPEASYFVPGDEQERAEYMTRFAWCGFAEDPDPL